MARLTPIFELGVAEAYAILTTRLGVDPRELPPLVAIENEDWGRDLLLSRFLDQPGSGAGRPHTARVRTALRAAEGRQAAIRD